MKLKTQEEFEKDVKSLYGERYDISGSIYVNSKTPITVKCNICSKVFKIRPNDLLSGHGCNCSEKGKYTGEYYKNKFKEIHGDKYDYSLINNNEHYRQDETIEIICPKHGVFKQKILYHLDGRGCRKCANEKCGDNRRLGRNEVVKRLHELCGENLTYDLDSYENDHTKIKFTCRKCGRTFERTLNGLSKTNTCPYCNGREDWSTELFIEKAKGVHGDRYDYSKSVYEKTDKKVIVICHEKDKFGFEHGEFEVTPHAHIGSMKSGCPKCSGKHKYTTEEFIREANHIHNNFYNYDKTEYNGAFKKVTITCPIHGDFQQKPNGHLSGQGCPHCKTSKIENEIATFLIEKEMSFIRQYSPEWLKTQKTSKQTLDFYLPDYNVAIEVQGEQHFKPVKYWGGEDNFEKVLTRDKRKKDLCEKNNVYLIYYSECKNLPQDVISDRQMLLETILKLKNYVKQ